MAQSIFDRLWNRLVSRYEPDEAADCCGPALEEVQSEPEGRDSDDCYR